jgi:hypothetical protein
MAVRPDHIYDWADHGGFAAMVWLVVGAFLFDYDPAARLFSWQGLVYFLVGVVVAAVALGGLSYVAALGLTRALKRSGKRAAPTARASTAVEAAQYLVFAVQAVAIYVAAQWTLRVMF